MKGIGSYGRAIDRGASRIKRVFRARRSIKRVMVFRKKHLGK